MADSGKGRPVAPARQVLLRELTRLDRSRMSATMALRNTLGVLAPIVAGHAVGQSAAGVIAGVGGLLVSYSDGHDPYRLRAKRLFATAIFCAVAVGLGTLAANLPPLAATLAVALAFAAGLAAALGQTIADLGIFSLVMFVVECTSALPPEKAAALALVTLVGGLLQMALALVLWPIRRYEPERRELGRLFATFGQQAASPSFSRRSPAMTAEMNRAQAALSGLVADRSVEGFRYRSIVNQAERIRLRLISLVHARQRLASAPAASVVDAFLQEVSQACQLISQALLTEEMVGPPQVVLAGLQARADEIERGASGDTPLAAATARHAQQQMSALAGQLRAALDLAQGISEPGLLVQYRRETERHWRLRFTSAFATLRANLTPRSTVFRHAVRLAVGVAIGEAVSRHWNHTHSYWLPMTIAIVLKPGYSSTVTRGTLRVLGTLAGLGFTTAVFALFHPGVEAQIALIAAHTFVLRWLGTANYGFFAAAVGGLIVLLASVAGASPMPLIEARALYTIAGGAIAIVLYTAWPTRGESQAREATAKVLDAYRAYFMLVMRGSTGGSVAEAEVTRARVETRVARSNAETAVDALAGEPSAAQTRPLYSAIAAAANRFVSSTMVIDAGESEQGNPLLDAYCRDAERTLSLLCRALRGQAVSPSELPDLRASYEAWAKSTDRALLLAEIDRMTNSLNTLSERVAILRRAGV